MNPVVELVLTFLLGGGIWQGVSSLRQSGWLARKAKAETTAVDAKTPVEVDSIVVQGAEQAVLTMSKALDTANEQNRQLRADAADKDRIIAELRLEVDKLRQKVDLAEETAADAKRQCIDLQDRLTAVTEQRRAH